MSMQTLPPIVMQISYTPSGSVLDDLNVSPYFSAIVISEELGVEKPSPEIFLLALRDVNASQSGSDPSSCSPMRPEECLHIGDELKW
jgi:FMN phosphatase YigB (HAD superfamily)